MSAAIKRLLYIYDVTAPPEVFDFLENETDRSFVNGLFYRARHRRKESFEIRGNKYEVVYDNQFHYTISPVIE